MDENIKGNDPEQNQSGEKEMSLPELLYKLWANKKLLLLWCMWGVLAGLIIAFSIPKEYTVTVKLAPEARAGRANMGGGLGALASMAGISTGGNTSSDAVYPQLYPEIVGSVPFALSLLDVPVEDNKGQDKTVKEYLLDDTHSPWWDIVMGLPGKVVAMIRSSGKEKTQVDSLGHNKAFKLTSQENSLVGQLRGRITASVDQKTNVITITSKMQDPMVSAVLADTVVSRLREYVTDYRTGKARKDLEYAMKLNAEAQQEYYKAQQRLADYIDRNQNLATQSARVTRERLENESALAFSLYNETSLQVQNAKSKVQETTPVYTVITPPTVPLVPTSPRRGLIIGGCTFLAFIACAAWILFGKPFIGDYKSKVSSIKSGSTPSEDSGKDSDKA